MVRLPLFVRCWRAPNWLAGCWLASCWLLGACQGPTQSALASPVQVDIPDGAFPGAAAVLSGFDAPEPESPWRVGDQALFGLRLLTSGQEQDWLLHLRLAAPIGAERSIRWPLRVNGQERVYNSRPAPVELGVYDGAGRLLGSSSVLAPADFLATGFAAACDLVRVRQQAMPDAVHGIAFYEGLDVEPLARATVSAMALLRVVEDDPVLAPLLWQVLERPSLWSVLGSFGAHLVVRPRFHAAVELPATSFGRPWRVPLQLLVNDAPALLVDATVGPTSPPFGLVGGIVAAVARHPRDPGRTLMLRLLAARRGPP